MKGLMASLTDLGSLFQGTATETAKSVGFLNGETLEQGLSALKGMGGDLGPQASDLLGRFVRERLGLSEDQKVCPYRALTSALHARDLWGGGEIPLES